MTIQDWGAVGEVVGAIAVLMTLIYLSIQIRQSTVVQRTQTHQQIAQERSKSLRMIIENSDLRRAMVKASSGIDLDEEEGQMLFWFTVLAARGFENELYLHEKGMIESDELDVVRTLLEWAPHIQVEALKLVRHTLTPRARSEIDKVIEVRNGKQRSV